LPVLVFDRISDAISKTFYALMAYMDAHNLIFNQDYTGFKEEQEL
jgi:hypothetical protein